MPWIIYCLQKGKEKKKLVVWTPSLDQVIKGLSTCSQADDVRCCIYEEARWLSSFANYADQKSRANVEVGSGRRCKELSRKG